MPTSPPSSPHGKITEVLYVKNQLLFPISWLNKQDYCEYQIYLENVKGIKVKPSVAMTAGKQVHEDLFQRFIERIHALLMGRENYNPCGNPNKCRSYRLKEACEHNCGGTAV
jgi:CRISPR/Cas system-associated exonuclease Cas4 (RecB family)